jgi:hypothetical protein
MCPLGCVSSRGTLTSPLANMSRVCAMLDKSGLWNHLRGITRREASVTMEKPMDHRGRSKTGEDVLARGFVVKPIPSFLH